MTLEDICNAAKQVCPEAHVEYPSKAGGAKPYFHYYTEDKTTQENEDAAREMQESLRELGVMVEEWNIEHDCIGGYLVEAKVEVDRPAAPVWQRPAWMRAMEFMFSKEAESMTCAQARLEVAVRFGPEAEIQLRTLFKL